MLNDKNEKATKNMIIGSIFVVRDFFNDVERLILILDDLLFV
jgi:hypothetical protein